MFWRTQEVAAATSLAADGQGLAGAGRHATFTPTILLRAAKHIAASCIGSPASCVGFSPAKLSPATNNSTGRVEPSRDSPVATSSTLRSLSPYLRRREINTPSHGFV